VVIQEKDLPEAERRLLLLPKLKRFSDNLKSAAERDAFQRHMRRYLSLYLPDCAFEISSTNRYTLTTHEATIISRKLIRKGDEIKYLNGIRVNLTTEEEEDLDLKGHDFSIVITTRKKGTSFFFGPGRFANHDCKANARLTTTGASGIKIIATRDIGIGEEITVGYDGNYFEENNCECLCKTCEDHCRNGWGSEDQARVNDSPKVSFRYQFRHKTGESLDASLLAQAGSSAQSTTESRKRPIRIPGDYLTAASHVGPTAWAHSDRCLRPTSVRAADVSTYSCPVCERHRRLYGYRWPKTKPISRYDNEERVSY
jgi:hypothetical protein